MIRAVLFLTLFALLSACGQPIPVQPDGSMAKVASDQPGGSLVGTWLLVQRWGTAAAVTAVAVDSLIITLRDGVTDELNYERKIILLEVEEWSESEPVCIETLDLSIDDYVACLMETASTKRPLISLWGSWGRIRIQSDNGRGHIHYDRWVEGYEYEDGTRTLTQPPGITYDHRLIVWDDQLILLKEPLGEDGQLSRSTR